MSELELAFTRYFAGLSDPRSDRTKKHSLADILGVTLCAVILRGRQFRGDRAVRRVPPPLAAGVLLLTQRHPQSRHVQPGAGGVGPEGVHRVLRAVAGRPVPREGLEAIAVDGKACRSAAGDTFSGCLQLVTAWVTENGLVLGQEAVADDSHEITAIPELLKALDLPKSIVTLDAAGCQTAVVEQIRSQGGDYLIAVKGNQPESLAAVVERNVTVIPKPAGIPDGWKDVRGVVVVHRERLVKGRKPTSTTNYHITSSRAGTAGGCGGIGGWRTGCSGAWP